MNQREAIFYRHQTTKIIKHLCLQMPVGKCNEGESTAKASRKKERGWSTVEIGEMLRFMVKDKVNLESKLFYAIVTGMMKHVSECVINQL